MQQPRLYRKRFMPQETIFLKDDVLFYQDAEKMVTRWNVFRPKPNFSHGVSCYFLKKGWKVSKFLKDNGELFCYYCDIIDTAVEEDGNVYIFTDLLADVILFADGTLKVADLGEIADALESGVISQEQVCMALRRLDSLLQLIEAGGFSTLTKELERGEV